jgi:transposase
LEGVDALCIDKNVRAHTGRQGTGIVDHTRDADGTVHGRLLDLVPGRSGKSYADWLKEPGAGFTAGIRTAALDPFHGYANPICDELAEAITVVDAFHVVNLVRPSSMRSAAGSSRTPWDTVAVSAIRSTESAGPSTSAPNKSPRKRLPGCM